MKMRFREYRTTPVRLLVMAATSSALCAAITIGLIWNMSNETPPYWAIIAVFGVCVGMGLFLAVLIIFMTYALGGYSSIFPGIRPKSFRGSMVYGVCLAVLFSIGSLFFNSDSVHLFLIFHLPGLAAGTLLGWSTMRVIKKKIVNNRIMIPAAFPENMQYKDYWKELVMLLVIMGISFVISREVFHSKVAWEGTLTGLFLGMCLYILLWASIYEKRNNVRLTFEYSESGQNSETSAI